MGKTERCPICNVPVKPENMVRHLDDNHPRHPDAPALRQKMKEDARFAPAPRTSGGLRVRPVHATIIAVIILIGVGLYFAAPFFDPFYGFNRDSCINETGARYHIHVSLEVRIGGSHVPIPTNVGRTATCTKPLHTHDGDFNPATEPARIHVESPVTVDFTLGDFFHVWGEALTPTQVMGCSTSGGNAISMTVNGTPSPAYDSLVLRDGQAIVVLCGPAA